MKTKLLILLLGILVVSCNKNSSNQQVELAKLKEQRQAIDEKIKNLESELQKVAGTTLNPEKFKFVGITEVKISPFDHFTRVQGKLDGDQNASVFAEASGTVLAKYADVGQHVSKGQVLAQLDDEQYHKQLEALETQYKFASDMFDKQKRLWDQKIGSEVQYLQAKTNKESLEQQIASLKQQIEKFKIKSPVDGNIEECNIRIGGMVSPDSRQVVYRVVAFRNLKVTAEVSEAYSSRVQKGDKLIVTFPDINQQIETKVDFVSQFINPVNRTFIIETKIASPIQNLKANMIAIIQINDYHTDSAVVLSMNVIQTDAVGSYVYVIRPKDKFNAAFKQPVKLGMSYNGLAEILEGVKPTEKIISLGYQELIDGEYVRF